MHFPVYFTSILALGTSAGAAAIRPGQLYSTTFTLTIGGRHPTTLTIPYGAYYPVTTSSSAVYIDAARLTSTPAVTPKPSTSSVKPPSSSVKSVTPLSSSKTVLVANSSKPVISSSIKPTSVVSSPTIAVVASPSATPSSSSVPTSNDPPASYVAAVLRHHNVHRSNHSASNIAWSQSLADTAKKIAAKCIFAHDTSTDGGGYGQNLAAGPNAAAIGTSITTLWYNSEMPNYAPYYGQATPGGSNFNNVFGSFGHFTQVVWKGTSQVGCYTYDCTASGLQGVGSSVPPYLTVCNYGPPGNYLDQFGTNVGSPLGNPTVNGNY